MTEHLGPSKWTRDYGSITSDYVNIEDDPAKEPLMARYEVRICTAVKTGQPFVDDDGYDHDGHFRICTDEGLRLAERIEAMLNG